MTRARLLLGLLVAAAVAAPGNAAAQTAGTVTVTTFVITGHGWGHGVGMSQWGALGYARHGFTYQQILAHYYPGTQLAQTPVSWIRVLLVAQARRAVISSTDPFSVRDGAGATHQLAAGSYVLTPTLAVRLDPAAPPEPLPGPLAFLPGKSPLSLGQPYRGSLLVTASGGTLSVVNRVPTDAYVRGVISTEMPHDWPLEALEAQAVAVRSYALARRRGGAFDVYADGRDQVYGGIAAETPAGDEAVAETRRQVLLYDGKVATTYYFASSGGRTAALTSVFPNEPPVPYLASVPDPYDRASPYHTWGPVVVPAAVAATRLGVPGLAGLRPVPASGRASQVVATGRAGDVTLPADTVRAALGLRSTWITVGTLSLTRAAGPVPPGASVTLGGRVEGVPDPTLEQRLAGAGWQPGPPLTIQPGGSFSVAVAPAATTDYRLVAGTVRSSALRVVVVAA